MNNLQDMVNKVKAQGKNQAVASSGGSYELPPPGTARLRLVGYFEIGKHDKEYKGTHKMVDKVQLVFELSGKNYEPREVDGKKIPIRITITMTLSSSENSRFFKLFSKMRQQDTKHCIELLNDGSAFLAEIVHSEDGKYANIDEATVRRAMLDTLDENGEVKKVPLKVDPAITEPKAFVWDFAEPADWDALYIEGEYPERKDEKGNIIAPARSKNVIQEKIKAASNFASCPIYSYALGLTTKEGEKALAEAVGKVSGDPLEGIE